MDEIDGPCEECMFEGCELERLLGSDVRLCFIRKPRPEVEKMDTKKQKAAVKAGGPHYYDNLIEPGDDE